MTTPDSNYVTWPELLEWAKAHGAVNDHIKSIEIGTTPVNGEMRGVVSMSGAALNEDGRPYSVKNDLARWVVTNQLIRWLP